MPRNSKKTEEQTPKVETPAVTVAPTEAPKADPETPATPAVETPVNTPAPEEAPAAPKAPEVPAAPAEPEAPAQQETPEPKETPKEETPAPAAQEPAVPAVAPTAPKVKKVKVILTVDIDSFINGERYQYPAKKMIEVPEDVAQILVYGNKGYRM